MLRALIFDEHARPEIRDVFGNYPVISRLTGATGADPLTDVMK